MTITTEPSRELASMTRMFNAACADLGLINEALALDPDDGGAEPILSAIEELRKQHQDAQVALNVAQVGEFAAQSASQHLSALLDLERQISDRAMAVMNALQEAASPIEGERMDCFVPAAAYRQFVDAHAELLYVRKHGAKPAAQAVQL